MSQRVCGASCRQAMKTVLFTSAKNTHMPSIEDGVVGIAGAHSLRAAQPGANDHVDQAVTGLNKAGAHTPLLALTSEADALAIPLELGNIDTRYRRLITPRGTRWKFFLSETPEEAPDIIVGTGFAGSESWDEIDVPRSIECAGFGQPFYTNFVYPFKCDPPLIPSTINYVGCYQQDIHIPTDWRGRRIYLYFEGAGAALQCFLDGHFVGYSQDSFLPAEFEISSHVHRKLAFKDDGEPHVPANHADSPEASVSLSLSIKCFRFCDGSYMECQDMWWLSGIHREVLVYSKPAHAAIWDYLCEPRVSPDPSSPHTGARLCVNVEVRELSGSVWASASGGDAGTERGEETPESPAAKRHRGEASDPSGEGGNPGPDCDSGVLSVHVSVFGPHRLEPGSGAIEVKVGQGPIARARMALQVMGTVGTRGMGSRAAGTGKGQRREWGTM